LGQHAFGEGPAEIARLKNSLYRQLAEAKGDVRGNYSRLFPEAYHKPATQATRRRRSIFAWYALALSAPLVLFVIYFTMLRHQSDQLAAKIPKTERAPAPVAAPAVRPWSTSLVEELRRRGVRAIEVPEGVRITLATLRFKPGSAEMETGTRSEIDDIVQIVRRHAPDSIIEVEGHASKEKTSNDLRDQSLSEDRAHTVAAAFMRSNFRRDRISARGFGNSQPVATNETEAGRAENRRVEIIVKK
jgi:flagellar motor protein MotB